MKKALTFTLLLSALLGRLEAQVILQDSFTYANGILTNVSGNLWTNYSGTIDTTVNNNRLEVFGNRAGDVFRPFSSPPSGSVVYASFTVNSTNLPVGSNYFAHFSINSTTFRSRIWGIGNQATAPNSWRLGVTAGASTGVPVPVQLDLATNVTYTVVVAYDTVNFLGTLWVDPTSESDPKALTIDGVTAGVPAFFSFRQSNASGQAGQIYADDLYVGNSFADVLVGAPKPPTVYYQPVASILAFEGNSTNLVCVAGGAGAVTFQWQHAGTNLVDDANNSGTTGNILSLVFPTTNQSGAYQCIVTSTTNSIFAGSVTSAVSQVTITNGPVPPVINQHPSSQSAFKGATVTFSVSAIGPNPITYQWKTNGVDIPGETSTSLVLVNVTTNNAATYRVAVTNAFGGVLSSNAVLTVSNPPAVSIAFLRKLVDPTTYLATNSTLPWQVTGTVTTFTNLTTGNTSSYYLQDGTAGINIFATFGSTFRPAQGDVLTFVGVLSSFNSTLELLADTIGNPSTSYTILSNNIATLPTPKIIDFSITNDLAFCETNLEGSVVMLRNVYFGSSAGTTVLTNANTTIVVSNANGETFNLFFSSQDQDTAGATLPEFAVSVVGPFTQVLGNATTPRNQGYNVTVTRFSDIVTNPITAGISKDGGIGLSWEAAPVSYPYRVLTTTNLLGSWTVLTNGLRFMDTNGVYTDPDTTKVQKFYRLSTP